jgi:hypothetical protein
MDQAMAIKGVGFRKLFKDRESGIQQFLSLHQDKFF